MQLPKVPGRDLWRKFVHGNIIQSSQLSSHLMMALLFNWSLVNLDCEFKSSLFEKKVVK